MTEGAYELGNRFPGKGNATILRMDTDDIAPPPKKARSYELGQDLSKLSVAELRALIDDLKTEAARVEQTLATKQSSKSAAESVFKR
jgi:uncharacterized small protein (DUF1192 family)